MSRNHARPGMYIQNRSTFADPKVRAKIAQLHRHDGVCIADLRRRYGCSRDTLRKLLREEEPKP